MQHCWAIQHCWIIKQILGWPNGFKHCRKTTTGKSIMVYKIIHACVQHVGLTGQTDQTSHIKHENKRNVAWCLIECLTDFKLHATCLMLNPTASNSIQHHPTRWPNDKMLDHPTMLHGVWSPNISRLAGPLQYTHYKTNRFHPDGCIEDVKMW